MFDDCFSDAGTIGPVEDARKENSLEGFVVDWIRLSYGVNLITARAAMPARC